LQFFSADTFVTIGPALRAVENEIFNFEFGSAVDAAMAARAKLNFKFQALEVSLGSQRFEAEAQRVGIDG
jgi:hypothetical protein